MKVVVARRYRYQNEFLVVLAIAAVLVTIIGVHKILFSSAAVFWLE